MSEVTQNKGGFDTDIFETFLPYPLLDRNEVVIIRHAFRTEQGETGIFMMQRCFLAITFFLRFRTFV
jgi:hypothetical protein